MGRQLKMPGYKVWKNLCSNNSFQPVDSSVDKVNKTLYGYIIVNSKQEINDFVLFKMNNFLGLVVIWTCYQEVF